MAKITDTKTVDVSPDEVRKILTEYFQAKGYDVNQVDFKRIPDPDQGEYSRSTDYIFGGVKLTTTVETSIDL